MNHYLPLGFISLLLLISLAGTCMADGAPGFLVYAQGGESSITNGTDGVYAIIVKDVVPYFHITDGVKSSLYPVDLLNNLKYPMNAALVLSDADNATTIMVQVANMSLSDGNDVITLQAYPLDYYEGELLKPFNDTIQDISTVNGLRFSSVGVYLEGKTEPLSNDAICNVGCYDLLIGCIPCGISYCRC